MSNPVVRKILAPVELTDAGAVDMDYAIGLAQQLGAELVLYAVIDTPATVNLIGYHRSRTGRKLEASAGGTGGQVSSETLYATVSTVVRKILQQIVDEATARGVDARGQVTVSEDVEDNILKEAMVERVDLIVLRSHARSGFMKALLGSTANEILSAAPCPVLVARAK